MNHTLSGDFSKKATDVRKDWSETVDTVVRVKPVFINRTHDNILMISIDTLKQVFDWVKYSVELVKEEDGSYTGVACDLDLIDNADTKDECINALVNSIQDYASDYYKEFSLWSTAPNTKKQLPFIMKALYSSFDEIKEAIVCQNGKI